MSRLSDTQRKALAPRIRGRMVHDLGAGDCQLSLELARLGAAGVFAVDEERMPRVEDRRIVQVQARFDEVEDEIDVAFVSWPINRRDLSLLALVEKAKTVVYLGKNTDQSMCGWPGLFKHLIERKIIDHVPDPRNSMIVYGDHDPDLGPVRRARALVGEEIAGLSVYERNVLTFEEAEAEAEANRPSCEKAGCFREHKVGDGPCEGRRAQKRNQAPEGRSEIRELDMNPVDRYANGSPCYAFQSSFPSSGIRTAKSCAKAKAVAFERGQAEVDALCRDRWPCGMGECLGVTRCTCGCHGWVAVINFYVSGA